MAAIYRFGGDFGSFPDRWCKKDFSIGIFLHTVLGAIGLLLITAVIVSVSAEKEKETERKRRRRVFMVIKKGFGI